MSFERKSRLRRFVLEFYKITLKNCCRRQGPKEVGTTRHRKNLQAPKRSLVPRFHTNSMFSTNFLEPKKVVNQYKDSNKAMKKDNSRLLEVGQ